MRTGIGIDTHRFEEGRRLVLGGVEIPGERGLAGHSDADVLTHAIVDALLGAASLGDIGELFPDTDELWRDADSMALLRDVLGRVQAAGWAVAHVDTTVVLERPKLAPHRDAIRESLAERARQRERQVHDRREDGLRRPRGGRRRAGGGHPRGRRPLDDAVGEPEAGEHRPVEERHDPRDPPALEREELDAMRGEAALLVA